VANENTERRWRSSKQWENIQKSVWATEDHCYLGGGYINAKLNRFMKDSSGEVLIDFQTGKKKVNPEAPEVDHVIPVEKGGDPLDRDNCRATHALCNNKKGAKFLSELDLSNWLCPTDEKTKKALKRTGRKRNWAE
jgi:5-methylcytosine-specific restriction endonuclease McrA